MKGDIPFWCQLQFENSQLWRCIVNCCSSSPRKMVIWHKLSHQLRQSDRCKFVTVSLKQKFVRLPRAFIVTQMDHLAWVYRVNILLIYNSNSAEMSRWHSELSVCPLKVISTVILQIYHHTLVKCVECNDCLPIMCAIFVKQKATHYDFVRATITPTNKRCVMLINIWINPVVCWYCLSILVLYIVYA